VLADALGGEADGATLVLGNQRIHVQEAPRLGWEVSLSCPAPAGCPDFRLRLAERHIGVIDHRLGDEDLDARWLVECPKVELMRAVFPHDIDYVLPIPTSILQVSEGTLTIQVDEPERMLDVAIKRLRSYIPRLLKQLSVGRWDAGPFEPAGLTRREGVVDGVPVALILSQPEDRLAVSVEAHEPMPLHMWHRGHGPARPPVNHPILDRLVCVDGNLRPLQDPEVMAACLAVAHGHPGSRIAAWGVRLASNEPLTPPEILEAARQVAAVVNALKR
jgi:hypothetical protein